MKDTPEHIYHKQRQIILSKTPEERFRMGLEMINDARKLVEEGIRSQNPGISEIDLKVEVFRRYYRNDFTEKEQKILIRKMREWYLKQQSERH